MTGRRRQTRRWRPLWAGVVAALATVAIAGSSVLADTELSHSGKVGKRSLSEPGATCNYGDGLYSFLIRPPTIYARNTTAGEDTGRVAWRFAVKRLVPGDAKWTTIDRSGLFNGSASDSQPATFSYQYSYPKTFDSAQPDGSLYYVVVKLLWYDAAGQISGRAARRVDSYQEQHGSDVGLTASECTDNYREAV